MLCALAFLLSGVVHHPAAQLPSAELAGYVLPDGTIPDLCMSGAHGGDDQSGGDHGTGHDCGPCCLSVAPSLPHPAVAFARIAVVRPSGAVRPGFRSVTRPVLQAGLGPRAPPYAGLAA